MSKNETVLWSMKWINGKKPPWILIDISAERKKQAIIRMNKMLNGNYDGIHGMK